MVALTASGSAYAADEDGNFALRGFGAQSCSVATSSLKSNPQIASVAIAWLQGYATAFNRMQSVTFDVSPLIEVTSLLQIIAGVCENAPDSRVETVAFDVLRLLAAARVTESTPIVETSSGEATARVRQQTLRSIQEELKKRGHLTGSADGAFGTMTEQALKSFQEAQELPVTGVADAATIIRLLVELPARDNDAPD